MNRFSFLSKYADPVRHFEPEKEINDVIDYASRTGESLNAVYPALKSEYATSENIDRALSSRYSIVRGWAAENEKASIQAISNALDDNDLHIRISAANNPNATKEHLDKALNDPDTWVRNSAVRHKNITKEQALKALDDIHPRVVESARNSLKKFDSLKESLDSHHELSRVPEDSMLHVMGAMSAAMIGGDNFSMHKIDSNGYLIQFDKDGATEFHHVDDELKGGYLKNSKPSFSFIGTYKKKIKDVVDSGKKVRIVAHASLGDKFKRITDKLIKTHPEYKTTDAIDKTHEMTGDALKSWEIYR
jgi:hypothetical protein